MHEHTTEKTEPLINTLFVVKKKKIITEAAPFTLEFLKF